VFAGTDVNIGGSHPFLLYESAMELLEWLRGSLRMAYRLVNLFCRVAGNLAQEREAFYQAVADCNAIQGMPRGVLFTPLSIGTYAPERKDAVDANLRVSQYFLLVVEDIWEAPLHTFLHDYRLAMKCRADAGLPMQELAVMLKKTPAGEDPGDLASFRAGLAAEGAPRHFEFSTVDEFRSHLDPLLSDWLALAVGHAPLAADSSC